ncbi:MAG: tRNA pseudouridine(38-40) synthase TruA [Cryobacterium sp.]|nr:tRNA pseudouridine(38-40) synthase TruA [Cryobacterium sp.]MBX3116574.1 tRNA pseudouridine(38-40) synthase TruA [Cryobacterium sp.]MCC7128102.1 tRNA pseudouridine(38-40) synthase TruA [Microbacteriaceae bacterium]
MAGEPDLQLSRVRLSIAYDGTDFHGWSRQSGLRTVQGELEAALETIFGRFGPPPKLTVAGRTDAGVHALGQVAHLDLTARQLAKFSKASNGGEISNLAHRLNGIAGLESDVRVLAAELVSAEFDARFSAIFRSYQYRIADAASVWNPVTRRMTLFAPARLDLDRMSEASESLLGLHDWTAFCKSREESTNIRTLQRFEWKRDEDQTLVATVQADAFCHSMVRALVGGVVAVGERKLEPIDLIRIRDGRVRTSDFKVLPAKGLILLNVGYPPESEWASRSQKTRARRELNQRL